MPKPHKRRVFDDEYYDRYYLNARSRSVTESDVQDITDFVLAYAKRLHIPVRSVIDFGCGVGFWQACIKRRRRAARYAGIEISPYSLDRYGWHKGSVIDYDAGEPSDLVVCQSVLQYLNARDATRAIRNLARHTRALMYFEVVTREDWNHFCDQSMTDGAIYLRSAEWYRDRLSESFVNGGGGVWVPRASEAVLYALEQA